MQVAKTRSWKVSGSIIWKRRTNRSRDVFPVFLGDNYRTPGLRPSANFPSVARYRCRRRPADAVALSAGSDRSCPSRAGGRGPSARLPSNVIGNLAAMAGITDARWPAPIRRRRRLNFRPLHIVMISTLIDGGRVRGAPLEINLQPRDAARPAAEIRRGVSRAMQSRFSEDLTTRWNGGSGYRAARRPAQYFLINTSKAIDATSDEYIISSPSR